MIVDEIGTKEEVAAVKGSAQRGIVFIGTAHGVALANPDLNALVGGTQSVILSDAVARYGTVLAHSSPTHMGIRVIAGEEPPGVDSQFLAISCSSSQATGMYVQNSMCIKLRSSTLRMILWAM